MDITKSEALSLSLKDLQKDQSKTQKSLLDQSADNNVSAAENIKRFSDVDSSTQADVGRAVTEASTASLRDVNKASELAFQTKADILADPVKAINAQKEPNPTVVAQLLKA